MRSSLSQRVTVTDLKMFIYSVNSCLKVTSHFSQIAQYTGWDIYETVKLLICFLTCRYLYRRIKHDSLMPAKKRMTKIEELMHSVRHNSTFCDRSTLHSLLLVNHCNCARLLGPLRSMEVGNKLGKTSISSDSTPTKKKERKPGSKCKEVVLSTFERLNPTLRWVNGQLFILCTKTEVCVYVCVCVSFDISVVNFLILRGMVA